MRAAICGRDYIKEITITAVVENLSSVLEIVDQELEAAGASMKVQMQVDVAIEELFVNVSRYAYAPETGEVRIQIGFDKQTSALLVTFIDSGVPFDPVAKLNPDITLSAQEREIGGLGIFMAKKNMDSMEYRREDGKNILTVTKRI